MNANITTIEIPTTLFQTLKQRADIMHRPVEEFVAQTLAVATTPSDIPPDLAIELETMINFSDDALWSATKPSISTTERARLEQLNTLANERTLSDAEKNEHGQLLKAWQRSIARRARAFAILQLRGHPLPTTKELQASLEPAA